VSVPRPVDGGRIGGTALRDVALLDWCTRLLHDLVTPAKAPAAG
jgi:transcription-repair coupling factor (superfamily II helicase)